jgi:Flp pilus assembly protein CpaB
MDKKKISIVLAFVLALSGVLLLRQYLSDAEKKYVKQERKAYVLFATTNIASGSTIDETMFKVDAIPEQYVQPKALTSPSLAVGKRVIADIFQGEQIMATKLTIAVKDTSMSMRTPAGKRAMTITIPWLQAVGGKVRAGDYVDIVGVFPYNAQIEGKRVTEFVSVTLFQNVLVLSVEGASPPAERGKPAPPATGDLVVTLALAPREIALLTFAMSQQTQGNQLRLVLRPPLETVIEPVPPVEANAMWQYVFSNLGEEFLQNQEQKMQQAIKPQEKKQEAPPPPPTLEVYRGTEKSSMVMNK